MCHGTIMLSLVVIGQQIKEKQRGAHCAPPAYMVPKYPSLNRVNGRPCLLKAKFILGNADNMSFVLHPSDFTDYTAIDVDVRNLAFVFETTTFSNDYFILSFVGVFS